MVDEMGLAAINSNEAKWHSPVRVWTQVLQIFDQLSNHNLILII